ncbi:MAG: NupC/NupG family nucleoside CNT transporter [Candidatus Hydrogenedentes bacterium]|nr:NupC/NupG family nucleoside CNT transporter [Candidatus Hydrogenedentota bacterium]
MENVWVLRLVSLLGLGVVFLLAWLCSEHRSKPPWRLVLWGITLQFALGLVVLRSALGEAFFAAVKKAFDLVTDASTAGASFLFGNLTQFFLIDRVQVPGPEGLQPVEGFAISAVMGFKVLPVIIFVSGLSAILQHLGVIQVVVRAMSWLMRRTLKTSGAETFGTSLLVFMGIESASALGGYLNSMTRSEIFTIMTAFLATIAASVMVAYAGFGAEPGHLLAASLMSAPAAIAVAKLMVPELGTPLTSGEQRVEMPVESHNIFDAAALGASLGLTMALQVGALLIVFIGCIYLVNVGVSALTGQTLIWILGWFFRPFAFIMGVPLSDIPAVGELLATKSVFNEFLAYQQMQPLIEQHTISPRAITIASYALCGFANPGSLGIMIGALAGMMPERRSEVAQLSARAFIAGTLACFSTACVAGVLT